MRSMPARLFAFTALGVSFAGSALAYGPAGHRIAATLAEPLLCRAAAAEIAALSGGETLAEIGLWADRIRGEDAFRHTAPWHYMNIPDGADIDLFEHPPEGDVLWAIERHAARLTGPGSRAERADALRFLVHFVVDVHQPLHVGRESDRGGNTIDVRYADTTVNLHRFWDTDVLALAGLSERSYVQSLEPSVRALAAGGGASDSPSIWAGESLALRPTVYGFQAPRGGAARLDGAYLERADDVTRRRLAQAAVRLAGMLNRLLAPGERC